MPLKYKLVVEKAGEHLWRIYEEFDYHGVAVPKGFLTDFASVPRPFWVILPPDGDYTAAAVIHDFIYAIQDRTRKEADDLFLSAMKDLGLSPWKRQIMYLAVRAFGWLPWRNKEKGQINVQPR